MEIGNYVPSSTTRWAIVGAIGVVTSLSQVSGMNRRLISQGELVIKIALVVAGIELACVAAYRCYQSTRNDANIFPVINAANAA